MVDLCGQRRRGRTESQSHAGRGEEAVQSLKAALRRDPFPPAWVWDFLSVALFQVRRYREVVEALNRLPKLEWWDYAYLAASYAHLDQIEQAQECRAEVQRLHPNLSLKKQTLIEPYQDVADLEHLLDGLRKAGFPE